MDHLKPGHAHRSSSDRLLSNYLESQKLFTTSLLALLSQSHSSTSSLLAYVTSSPGVLLSVRRSVRHAAFEGPISPSMLENPEAFIGGELEAPTPGWAGYIRSLDDFRKDLKQIHLLEEEMTRVKRDKAILVGRLIRQTKTRPTKSDLKDMAKHLNAEQMRDYEMSSRASSISLASDLTGVTGATGAAGKENRRANKLKEAQAELLGCEEHLRALEVKIETERNNVMYRGLEERFRAMEIVSQMWLAQARAGLEDLEKLTGRADGANGMENGMPNGLANSRHLGVANNSFELESNGSLAPSQSASQVGYEDTGSHSATQGALVSPRRQIASQRQMAPMLGPGSITSVQEENEGSSDEEQQGTLVMHENVRRPVSQPPPPAKQSPPLPMKDFNPPSGGRRATSELGQPSRYSHAQREPLRRAMSTDHVRTPPRAASDSSSIRTVTKRRGFFASIARFFKGPPKQQHNRRHSRRPGSPTMGTWGQDSRPRQQYGRRVRSDSSSDEDDMYNLVQVSNTLSRAGGGGTGGWSVADVGKVPMQPKRPHSSASAKRANAGSTTPRARPASAAAGTPTRNKTTSGRMQTATTTATGASVSRSGTVRSNTTPKRSSTVRSRASTAGPSIMTIVDAPPPAMPDVPKAPRRQAEMGLVKAPGSSLEPGLVLPSQVMHHSRPVQRVIEDDELGPNDSISRANSAKRRPTRSKSVERRKSTNEKKGKLSTSASASGYLSAPEQPEKATKRSVSPLPPSKMRSPPLKSAMRPTSPSSYALGNLPPPEITTLYDVHAPGPVELPPDPEPDYEVRRSTSLRRMQSADDGTSIYESAEEDGGTPRAGITSNPLDESSDDESVDASAFQMVTNPRETPSQIQAEHRAAHASHIAAEGYEGETPLPPLPQQDEGAALGRRKSVRLSVPGGSSENVVQYYQAEAAREAQERDVAHERELEKERARMYLAAANASDDSLPVPPRSSDWSTRIGRMREDTSEDDDEDPRYMKARRSLMSNKGDFKSPENKKKRMSLKGSKKQKGEKEGKEGKGKPWRP